MPKKVTWSTDPDFVTPKVDAEFLKLMPVQDAKQDAKLEFMLVEEGEARDAVIVWKEENILVDGHRRSRLCAKHGLPYPVEYKSFPDRRAVKKWMRDLQLHGRRNLTDFERSFFIGDEWLDADEETTAANVAKKNKVSRRRVFRDAKFARAAKAHDAAKPGTLQKILKGEAGKSKDKIIESAPVLCDRCIRIGRPVINCPSCAEKQAEAGKRKPKPKKDLFEDPVVKKRIKEEAPPKEPLEELEGLVTKVSTLFTKYLATPADGEINEVWDRMRQYMTWAGLLWFEKKGADPKFLPLLGVRKLMDVAQQRGERLKFDEVQQIYEKAAGVWVPPKTKDYQRRRGT